MRKASGTTPPGIEVLEGREAIRKRPGMYVGSTGERGLHQLVFEVAGRAVNEVLAGRAGSVDVTLTPDGGVRVADDGPGGPRRGRRGHRRSRPRSPADQPAAGPSPAAATSRTVGHLRRGTLRRQRPVEPPDGRGAARGGPLGPGVRARRRGHPAHRRGAGDRERDHHHLLARRRRSSRRRGARSPCWRSASGSWPSCNRGLESH